MPSYTVEPGDVLLVLPTESEASALGEPGPAPDKNPPPPVRIPPDQPILPDGSINLGIYGRLIVAGKTVEEMELMIRATVQAQIHRDPGFITVRIVTRDSKVYYVLGEVNTPGGLSPQGARNRARCDPCRRRHQRSWLPRKHHPRPAHGTP